MTQADNTRQPVVGLGRSLDSGASEPGAAASPTPRQEAAQALKELKAALSALGIKLPSLDIDPLSARSAELGSGLFPRPLIELGRCNIDVARALAQALRRSVADED
jgi:hypothetical protein